MGKKKKSSLGYDLTSSVNEGVNDNVPTWPNDWRIKNK